VSAVVLELALAAAAIHFTLGSGIQLLNAGGYLFFGALYAAAVLAQVPAFSTLTSLGLGGYTLLTIAGYLIIGPYFALGWATKAIEAALVGLLAAEYLLTQRVPNRQPRSVGTGRPGA
jgi:hypothetical protein